MRIVDSYARLLPPAHVDISDKFTPFTSEHGLQLVRRTEWYARISHRSEDKMTPESYRRFLQTWVAEHGDYSTIEHLIITADILVDRGLSHELVRHRLAAYTQESTRFVNYGKKGNDIDVILPPELREFTLIFGPDIVRYPEELQDTDAIRRIKDFYAVADTAAASRMWNWFKSWIEGIGHAERAYMYQVNTLKVAPELARDMLPHALATRMVMTHNLRNWRHLMIMRTTNETHRKLRPLMKVLLAELKEKVPVLYDDLEPDQKQSENLKKGR